MWTNSDQQMMLDRLATFQQIQMAPQKDSQQTNHRPVFLHWSAKCLGLKSKFFPPTVVSSVCQSVEKRDVYCLCGGSSSTDKLSYRVTPSYHSSAVSTVQNVQRVSPVITLDRRVTDCEHRWVETIRSHFRQATGIFPCSS